MKWTKEQRKTAMNNLTKARELLEKGWVGRGPNGREEHCAMTAINKVRIGKKTWTAGGASLEACVVLEEANKQTPGPALKWGTIPAWNDCQSDKSKVLGVFDGAIQKLKSTLKPIKRA